MGQVEPIKLTAFLDILGFGEMISSIDTEEKAQACLSRFEILKVFNNVSNEIMKKHPLFEPNNLSELYSIEVIFISDSIIISYMPNREVIINKIDDIESLNAEIFILLTTFIAQLQILTVEYFNCFLRGGICDEFSYIRDMHAVGKGISSAYGLEVKKAIYPRVIFKKEIIEKYKINNYVNKFNEASYETIQFYTISDNEKYAYINYFNTFDLYKENQEGIPLQNQKAIEACAKFVVLHVQIIENELAKVQDEKIFDKYKWLDNFQIENLQHLMVNQFFRDHLRQTHPVEYSLITNKLSIQKRKKISLHKKIILQFKKVINCLKQK